MQASLNEFRNWQPEWVADLFSDFPPLPDRQLYPMGPECRYPPPGSQRWKEFAGKLAIAGVADAMALATLPLTLPFFSKQQRKEAVSGLVDVNVQTVTSSLFVSASLELMEEAGRRNQALCVNKWGQFKILNSGYAAISHVWAETMGLEFNNEKIEQDGRGMLMMHLNKIMGKALQCGHEWIWFDLLTIPKKSDPGTSDLRLKKIKILIINSLHSVYRNADAIIILDSFPLHLPSGDPLRVAALLVCGLWLTRVWTYQEIKLAHKALVVTATHVVDFQDIVSALEHQANLDRARWYELHRSFHRLQAIYGPGINLADVVLSCTNRSAENEVDNVRGFYALLGLQWQVDWTYEDGIQHIYNTRPQEAAMIASMHSPRGLPSPFSWAPKYLTQLQGESQAAYRFTVNSDGLLSSWYTLPVRQLVHVASYGLPNDDTDDKMAFQLLVEDVHGTSLTVTVVTWGSTWTRDLKIWTDLIPSGNARLLCSREMTAGEHFPIVLLSVQNVNSVPSLHARGLQSVGCVSSSAVFVNGDVKAPLVPWLLT